MSATILDLRTGVDKDAVAIGNLCSKARGSMVDSVKYLIEAGQKLIAKKKSLQHGEWLPWLKENADALGFSSKHTAARLMKVATKSSASATFTETEAAQISKSVWGHTSKKGKSQPRPRGVSASKYQKTRLAVRESIATGETLKTKEVAMDLDVSVDTVERAALAEQARIDLLDELSVDPETLAPSAKAKLEIAKRQIQRALEAEHAVRMHKLNEEVRQRVLKEGKDYREKLQGMEDKAYETEKFYRDMTNNRQPLFTMDQYNLIRKCLHQSGVAATAKDFDAAFDLIQKKKLQLTGQK